MKDSLIDTSFNTTLEENDFKLMYIFLLLTYYIKNNIFKCVTKLTIYNVVKVSQFNFIKPSLYVIYYIIILYEKFKEGIMNKDQTLSHTTGRVSFKELQQIIKMGLVQGNLIPAFAGAWLAIVMTNHSFLSSIPQILLMLVGSTLIMGALVL